MPVAATTEWTSAEQEAAAREELAALERAEAAEEEQFEVEVAASAQISRIVRSNWFLCLQSDSLPTTTPYIIVYYIMIFIRYRPYKRSVAVRNAGI